ncbi:aspartate aminotransferase family protein [Streptomyces ipomoeae]|uniref:aminotransferase family protein n=1 Tax=Streptomyces ipomoeae TaxID=103232 RepID=UPI0011474440|nr:aminotransferase class III-fold pyridoxal phosphate-dependent enzyme [Streptomyces ipomoeae]MDX2938370.1 aminotransferase class III-fold pyridoxal phosphate-dependent enzyme [Streptomyces ipomoeae]TQE22072.1 aspartate aminotransferase family protein [Streptomyces ipomoeae]
MPSTSQSAPTTAWGSTEKSAFCFEVPYSAESILFESAKGIRLTDVTGREYLDAMSGVFVTCFGYDCEPIVDAVTEQLRRLPFNPPLHGTSRPAIELANELVNLAPTTFSLAKLVNGGSEAVEAAVRLARLYHREKGNAGKYKVLSYFHGYHGATFGSLTVTGRPDTTRFGPGVPGVVHVWTPHSVAQQLGVGPEEAGRVALTLIEQTIEAEDPGAIAALVVEPVVHLLGMAVPPPGFLPGLRRLCDKYGILLVFDEIVTGFGRTGHNFAADTFHVVPDLICAGKGISGGYAPLAAVLISERIASVLATGEDAYAFAPSHTYAANPVSAAAGLAAVRLFKELDVPTQVRRLSERLGVLLQRTVGERGAVRMAGLLYGVTLTAEPVTAEAKAAPGQELAQACLRRGLIIRGQDDWVVLAPAFVATDKDLDEIAAILGDALDEVFGGAR